MRYELDFYVIGGDMRQIRLAELLQEDGHTVHTFALEQEGQEWAEPTLGRAAWADCVILPLPAVGTEGRLNAPLCGGEVPRMTDVLDALRPFQIICGGMMDSETVAAAQERRLVLHDYYAREEFAVANAVPTAEGTIQLAMEELPITLHGARVLIIGYGRVGRMLAPRLRALGARVTVAARKFEQLVWAESCGCETEYMGQLAGWLCSYDLVVNTVPARVLQSAELLDLKAGCLIIDLASAPGGVDMEQAEKLGVRAIRAGSLPGKTAPATAGKCVKDTIYNILRELGV